MNLSNPNHPMKKAQNSRFFQFGYIQFVVCVLRILSTNIKDKLMKNALAFRVCNIQARALGGIIFACKKVEVVVTKKKKDLHAELVSIVIFTLCYQQEGLFDSFLAEICNPSNNDNDKNSWILFQISTTAEDFDTTALKILSIVLILICLPPKRKLESVC